MKDFLAVIALSVFGFVLYGAMTGDRNSDCSIAAKMTGVCIQQKAKLARDAEKAKPEPTDDQLIACADFARLMGYAVDARDSGVPLAYFNKHKAKWGEASEYMMEEVKMVYGHMGGWDKKEVVRYTNDSCVRAITE